MRVDCALLCDAATVREGLLHLLGGGITRLHRAGYPASLAPLTLALRIMVHPTETDRPHKLDVRLQGPDGEEAAKVDVEFGIGDPGQLEPGEEVSVPVPLTFPPNIALPRAGSYSFELLIDGIHQATIPFVATHVPQGGTP